MWILSYNIFQIYINDINYTLEIINHNAITESTLNNTEYMFILSINNVSQIKTKSIINKEDIETKYGIVTYNPNKPNKKGND